MYTHTWQIQSENRDTKVQYHSTISGSLPRKIPNDNLNHDINMKDKELEDIVEYNTLEDILAKG